MKLESNSIARRRVAAVAIVLAFTAGTSEANIAYVQTDTFAKVSYVAGTGPGTFAVSAQDPYTPILAPPQPVSQVSITVPAFTPPTGAPGDTQFQPAQARAYQSTLGFNTTSVEAAIADGVAYHRLEARTAWTTEVQILQPLPSHVPITLTLDYLLFPGELGLSRSGDYVGLAGYSAEIYFETSSTAGVVWAAQSEASLSRTGAGLPVVQTSGDFGSQSPTPAIESHGGMLYDVVHTDPVIGSVKLGEFQNGDTVTVTYAMTSWLEIPGWEVGGFARVGDPFGLSSDPEGYVASIFPGHGTLSFTVQEAVAPVPLPGGLVLLASGLAIVVRRRT